MIGSGAQQIATAADAEGQFAVRGAGLMTCEIYTHERAAGSPAYLVSAAWVDGYITATNQHLAATYDVMPFESTELLAEVIDRHCAEHPSHRVFPVIQSLVAKLFRDRLQTRSDKVDVAQGERQVSLYVDIVERMQSRLRDQDRYQGAITGAFDSATRVALMAYQQSIGFEPTGFPDQATLWRLLRTAPPSEQVSARP